MNIFVTGATGVLWVATVPQLVAGGHRVRVLARDAGSASASRQLGAEPVPGTLFDRSALHRAVSGCHAVLHLATRIPPTSKVRLSVPVGMSRPASGVFRYSTRR